MDSSQQGDAAFLISDQLISLPAIFFEQWTKKEPDVCLDLVVYAFGFPSAFKVIKGRCIVDSKLVFLGPTVSSVESNSLTCWINEKIEKMPARLNGMSGGGLFSLDGEFLGILTAERRGVSPSQGEFDVLLPSAYEELYKPFETPPDAPKGGFFGEKISMVFQLIESRKNNKLIATVGVMAETLWSITNPEHTHGRIGRLLTLEIVRPGIPTHYPINIESVFFGWDDDSFSTRRKAVQEEFRFLLMRMGWVLKGEAGDSQASIQINPMI
jgi:hypothetical protein